MPDITSFCKNNHVSSDRLIIEMVLAPVKPLFPASCPQNNILARCRTAGLRLKPLVDGPEARFIQSEQAPDMLSGKGIGGNIGRNFRRPAC
jgi:hypothetical protein